MFDLLPILFVPAAEGGGGFDPINFSASSNFLWTLIIFGLSLLPIWKIVLGPIVQALEDRDDRAARAIASAETASAEAEKARAEVEVALGEAQAEAAKLMTAARERAEGREQEIVKAAKTEAANLLDNARAAIQAEKDKALSAIRNEVVDLSLNAASKVLERNVGGDDDRRMVSELVSRSESARN